jgi:uncharacterized protein (DUF1015 family)
MPSCPQAPPEGALLNGCYRNLRNTTALLPRILYVVDTNAPKEMNMAEVHPFRGILYNPESIANMADVVAPPYDVISPREQDAFYNQHPNNVVRLILGKARAGDTGTSDIHARAAAYFEQWMAEKILTRDDTPAFYLTSVTFSVGAQRATRYGIIGGVRLEPFDKGVVLPHERTFSKVKTERLQLMQACHTNFSPVFGLYNDEAGILDRLIKFSGNQTPDLDFIDRQDLGHKMWRIVDPEMVQLVTSAFSEQCIYIADGHHRYETALNYRDWVKQKTQHFDTHHPANFIMMSLSSMQDPGLVILPAHRLLKDVRIADMDALLKKIGTCFEVLTFSTDSGLKDAMRVFDSAMADNVHRKAIGMYGNHEKALNILLLKEGVMEELFAGDVPEALRDLDVTVLTRLLMMEILGFDQNRLDDATVIGYATTTQAAVQAVEDREAELAFILNPTKIEQVQRVARHGLIMPRKSTYFYPKVGSGIVFNLLR